MSDRVHRNLYDKIDNLQEQITSIKADIDALKSYRLLKERATGGEWYFYPDMSVVSSGIGCDKVHSFKTEEQAKQCRDEIGQAGFKAMHQCRLPFSG